MRLKGLLIWGACAACTFVGASQAPGAFTITVNYADGTVPTASEKNAFDTAAWYWEHTITGYQAAAADLSGITITATIAPIDGAGGKLGSAGPTLGTTRGTNFYSVAGQMTFDSADVGSNFQAVVLHEMAHVIGFGTLWTDNNLYVTGSGKYTGSAALAAYKAEYSQPSATSVPVEQGGGAGTYDAHWDEVDGGTGSTGLVDSAGRDKKYELMTGWLNLPGYVSQTTVAQFQDLGYTTVAAPLLGGTIPVPEAGVAGVLAPVGLLLRRRR